MLFHLLMASKMFSGKWYHTLFFSNVKLTTAPSHTQEQLVSAQSHHGYLSWWLSCPSLLLFLKPMHKCCTPLSSPSRNTKNVFECVWGVNIPHPDHQLAYSPLFMLLSSCQYVFRRYKVGRRTSLCTKDTCAEMEEFIWTQKRKTE